MNSSGNNLGFEFHQTLTLAKGQALDYYGGYKTSEGYEAFVPVLVKMNPKFFALCRTPPVSITSYIRILMSLIRNYVTA